MRTYLAYLDLERVLTTLKIARLLAEDLRRVAPSKEREVLMEQVDEVVVLHELELAVREEMARTLRSLVGEQAG